MSESDDEITYFTNRGKRQRIIDDMCFAAPMDTATTEGIRGVTRANDPSTDLISKHGHIDDPSEDQDFATRMTYEQLVDVGFKDCYACECMNVEAIAENENYLYMMKLYTQNASTICKDAIFKKVKHFFDTVVKPDLESLRGPDDPPVRDWSLWCIKEHFTKHTHFPTDEILTQIRIKRALRAKLSDNLVETMPNGKLRFNSNNIKHVIALDKEIVSLLRAKNDISTMVGYCEILDF